MSVCNNCGMDMPGEVKFCIRCGSRVAAPAVSASVPAAPVAPVVPTAPVNPTPAVAPVTPVTPDAQTPVVSSAPATPIIPAPVSESASALTPFVQSGTATAQAANMPVTPTAPAVLAAPAALQPVQVQPSEATKPKYRTQYTGKQDKTPNIGTYLGFLLLFNIPLIGWVICIVTAIASDNNSIKNLARAQLVFFLIIMALSAAAGFVIYYAFESIASFLSDNFGIIISGSSNFGDVFGLLS